MTTDDDRIAYLSGDDPPGQLDDGERDDLDEMRALLADHSVWAEPPRELEDAVVAAVSGEVAAASAPAVAPSAARPRRARWLRAGSIGAAAAAAAIVLVVLLVPGQGSGRTQLRASLQATELTPDAKGHASFTKTDSGWRIELDATGLPRLDDGRYYQAWLRDGSGVLVAIGTFNEPDDVVLWAGVSPRDFSTITVTRERADDNSASSGRRVLAGSITER